MMNATESSALSSLFNLLTKHNESTNSQLLVDFKTPNELLSLIDFKLQDEGIEYAELMTYFEEYLKYAVNTAHPQFTNQLWSGQNFPAVLGEIITSFTNTSAYTFEVAPVATLIENELIREFCNYVGYSEGDGTFVTGGSNANLLSMIVARNTKLPLYKEEGASHYGKIVIFVSDQAHYSFEKAVNSIGIGTKNIIKVKSDASGKMIAAELEKEILASKTRNETQFYVAATLGTTELGAFDNIDDIYAVSKKHDLWLHGDGAWGGSVLLSQKHKNLIKNSHLCDSFAWDAHKLMGIPLVASLALFKDKNVLLNSVSTENSSYIFHQHDLESYDLGRKSLQCGRRIDSLKLWSALKFYGKKGYEVRIDRCFELAAYLKSKIIANPNLELLAEPEFLNINFRFVSDNMDMNQLNLRIREDLHFNGKALVNYCWLDKEEKTLSIRYVISNPSINESDLDNFINLIVEAGLRFSNHYE